MCVQLRPAVEKLMIKALLAGERVPIWSVEAGKEFGGDRYSWVKEGQILWTVADTVACRHLCQIMVPAFVSFQSHPHRTQVSLKLCIIRLHSISSMPKEWNSISCVACPALAKWFTLVALRITSATASMYHCFRRHRCSHSDGPQFQMRTKITSEAQVTMSLCSSASCSLI